MVKGDYRLICGDANKVIPRLADEGVQVDMVFCSPNPLFISLKEGGKKENTANVGSEPTLTDYLDHLCVIFSKARRILKDSGSLWVHMMDIYMLAGSMLQVPERFAFRMVQHYEWLLRGKRVWIRGQHEVTTGANISPWDWEYIYWFTQQAEGYVWRNDSPFAKTSVTYAPYEKSTTDGGSGFPHRVMRELISLTTRKGDTVMDCFLGTGETGIAALEMGRKFIGIDLLPETIALAQRRLKQTVVP